MSLLFAFVLLTTVSQAGWDRLSEERHFAKDAASVKALGDRFPKISFEKGTEKAEIVVVHFRWSGASSCEPGDPRLTFDDIMFRSYSSTSEFHADPCAEDSKVRGHWEFVSERQVEHRTVAELAAYRAANPDALTEDQLDWARETFRTYQWTGKTACESGDPRLRKEEWEGGEEFPKDEQTTFDPCAPKG
jgi:hypothetical protein